MITNTCLIGGSFFAGLLADSLEPPVEDPLSDEPEELPSELEEPVLELAGAFAAGVVLVAVGVCSGSLAGGSLLAVEAEDSEDVVVGVEEAPEGDETILTGERVEASVSSTPELATLPSSTPKPRNTSTSSAETGRDGSRRPFEGGTAPAGVAPVAVAMSTAGAPPEAASSVGPASAIAPAVPVRPRTRLSSSSSCWERDPTRAPQARQ
jgi:hypothetical protein